MDLRPLGRPLALPALLAGLSCTGLDEAAQSDPRELWSEEDVVAERTFLPAVIEPIRFCLIPTGCRPAQRA